jgi:SNF2 family DNA or RNA helicase
MSVRGWLAVAPLFVVCIPGAFGQLPKRVEKCLPYPTLAQEIREMQPPDPAPPQVRVHVIRVEFDPKDGIPSNVQEEISTQLQSHIFERDANRPYLSDLANEIAEVNVRGVLQNHGYFGPTVFAAKLSTLQSEGADKNIEVAISATPGTQYHTGNIRIESADSASQFWISPEVLRELIPLDVLLEQLREVLDEGHKALVFSQFTSFLRILQARLKRDGIPYEYLDGATRDRQTRVERFQNDHDCPLFLVSLKAGGLGLNLTAAEYVFILDPWWNPAVEAQAVDRAHRIGQLRPIFAYRLIARDTVEEKVLELQKTKRDLANALIGAENSMIQDLRTEDLAFLLS